MGGYMNSACANLASKIMKPCRRSYWSIFVVLLSVCTLLAGVQPAGAQINPVPLPNATCPNNLNSCTANDVVTTIKSVQILNGDSCNSLTDTIQLRITSTYTATSNARYDLGLFVSRDGGTVQEPSTANLCAGAAAQVGQGNGSSLFLDLDPSGHSDTPSTAD